MKQKNLIPFLVLAAVAVVSAQAAAQTREGAARRKVIVNGTAIAGGRVMTKDGVEFVDASALAVAMGASVESSDTGLIITSKSCDKGIAQGQKFSQEFRGKMASMPDRIESLRAAVMKKDSTPLGPRFDEIDRELTLATTLVQTDADMAVYYALSYANNSLAISYYKQARGASGDDEQKDQLDSMMCSMESKFALMKGVLLSGSSCSVLKRIEAKQAAKTSDR